MEGLDPNPDDNETHLARKFGFWSLLALGWNIINCFSGLSYLFVVGFSAGGLPSIFYGFIVAWLCNMALTAIIAECAANFPTAGGCYHFAVFLSPPKYRRGIGYVVGWFSFLGIAVTSAGLNIVLASLINAVIRIWHPELEFHGRWPLFLLYLAFAIGTWLFNLFGVKGVAYIGQFGCYMSNLGFVAFSIALLALAPKTSASTVFLRVFNATGYSDVSLVVMLGAFSSISSINGLDAACHLAEEVHEPTKIIPKVLYVSVGAQIFIGIAWILVVGFFITDIAKVVESPTGVPILEVMRLGMDHSSVAATMFWVVMFSGQIGAGVGAMLSASRQSFAFARDGGMFARQHLTHIGSITGVPSYSVHLTLAFNVVLGCIYLASSSGFNAMLGGAIGFCYLKLRPAAPAAVMLFSGRSNLEKTPYSLGKWGCPLALISLAYVAITVTLSVIPQTHPVTALTMNYASVVIVGCLALMGIAWVVSARKHYRPPSFERFVATMVPESQRSEFVAGGHDKADLEDRIAGYSDTEKIGMRTSVC